MVLPADLDRELRRADHGSPDALARIDQRQLHFAGQLIRQRAGERLGNIAEFLRLVTENIFGDAAGECQRRRCRGARQRFGEHQRLPEAVERRTADYVGGDRGKALRDAAAQVFIGQSSRRDFYAEIVAHKLRRMIDPAPGAVRILRHQPAADREGAEPDDGAAVDQR